MNDVETRQRIQENIRSLMEKRKLSGNKLAELSGTSAMTISRILNGSQIPTIGLASRIAAALDTTVDFLLREPEKVPSRD